MTVALVLAAQPDAGLRGQLAALGVRRVDAAERAGPGLLTVAAAARAAGERVLICVGDDSVPEDVLARLLGAGGTAAFTGPQSPAAHGGGALVVDTPDLDGLAGAAESLAARRAAPAELGALLGELTRRGVGVRVLDAGPDSDGAVARLIAGPVARDVACWAAGRQLAPAPLYGISLGLGLLAAVWFSEPAVRAQVLAIVVLLVSFAAGRAAAQLAAVEGTRPAVGLARRGGRPAHRVRGLRGAGRQLRPRGPEHRRDRRAERDLRRLAARLPGRRLGRCRPGRRVAAGRRGDAPAGSPAAGRGVLRGPGPGVGEHLRPAGPAPGRADHHPARGRAGRGDRGDRRLLRSAPDLRCPPGLGRGGGGLRAGRAAGRRGQAGPGRLASWPPTAETAPWRTGWAAWCGASCRRCRRCWWACW